MTWAWLWGAQPVKDENNEEQRLKEVTPEVRSLVRVCLANCIIGSPAILLSRTMRCRRCCTSFHRQRCNARNPGTA